MAGHKSLADHYAEYCAQRTADAIAAGKPDIIDTEIGGIGNRHGSLVIAREFGECWWGFACDDGEETRERIPEALFDALLAYEASRKR